MSLKNSTMADKFARELGDETFIFDFIWKAMLRP